MMKFLLGILCILVSIIAGVFITIGNGEKLNVPKQQKTVPEEQIRYVALGDSFTIGEGVSPEDRYPNQLVKNLKANGIDIVLVVNPSMSGFTTADVIQEELPIFENSNPTFATLLIGANDLSYEIDTEVFRKQFSFLLDSIIATLPSKDRLIVLTIPDFSVTPVVQELPYKQKVSNAIQVHNEIIKEEATKRNIHIVDIFFLSKKMKDGSIFVGNDGLHPTGKMYQQWVELLYPSAYSILEK